MDTGALGGPQQGPDVVRILERIKDEDERWLAARRRQGQDVVEAGKAPRLHHQGDALVAIEAGQRGQRTALDLDDGDAQVRRVEDQLLEGRATLRDHEQAACRSSGDERLLDGPTASDQLLVFAEGLRRRHGAWVDPRASVVVRPTPLVGSVPSTAPERRSAIGLARVAAVRSARAVIGSGGAGRAAGVALIAIERMVGGRFEVTRCVIARAVERARTGAIGPRTIVAARAARPVECGRAVTAWSVVSRAVGRQAIEAARTVHARGLESIVGTDVPRADGALEAAWPARSRAVEPPRTARPSGTPGLARPIAPRTIRPVGSTWARAGAARTIAAGTVPARTVAALAPWSRTLGTRTIEPARTWRATALGPPVAATPTTLSISHVGPPLCGASVGRPASLPR